ncbi:hypothetical protein [Fontibacillus sp. BL9]|uniref:hypothetical protein n=1 Tax=Fontibacillus sp. BL9 TaxID=3389971 RepID=UPI00397A3C06
MKAKSGKNEQGYALLSTLFLIAILLVIGTLLMRTVANSQGMVNVSSDLMAAQADGETKLMVKLAEIRSAVMALKEEEKITLEKVSDTVATTASTSLDTDSVLLDKDKLKYSAVIAVQGKSGKITQTASKKIEVTLSYVPDDPPAGGGNNGFAVVSQGAMMLNGAIIEGSVYAAGGLNNNHSTVKGQTITPTSPGHGVVLPGRVEVSTLIAKVDKEANEIKNVLLQAKPTEPDNFEVKQNKHFAKSTALNSFKLMSKAAVTVDGDLVINGELTMENGTSLSATGNIIIERNLIANGGEINLRAGTGKFIRVNGTTNFNSNPKVVISGDFYTRHLNVHGTLLAGKVFVDDSTTGTLNGMNQFSLYGAGSIVLGGNNKAELTGYVYSNGSVHVNGNGQLTIHGMNTGSEPEPDEPQEIVFDEKNMVIL